MDLLISAVSKLGIWTGALIVLLILVLPQAIRVLREY